MTDRAAAELPRLSPITRVAIEMRIQCGKSTDAPWDKLSAGARRRWITRAVAVLAAAEGRSVGLLDERDER